MKLGILHVLTIDRSCQTRKLKSHKSVKDCTHQMDFQWKTFPRYGVEEGGF